MELQSTFAQQDLYNLIQGDCDWENFEKNLDHNFNNNYYEMGSDHQHMPVPVAVDDQEHQFPAAEAAAVDSGSRSASSSGRRKRRSRTTKKNQEEIENQRMAHIAIERNRRKQMNDYLTILRRLIPEYYVIKADQASIIGGAINYVKELEQHLQFLRSAISSSSSTSSPFSEFFTSPQYSSKTTITTATGDEGDDNSSIVPRGKNAMTAVVTTTPVTSDTVNYDQNDDDGIYNMPSSSSCDQINDISLRYAAADIEVTMVENHANLKVRSKRRPKQLVKMVSGLQNLNLTVLHLNVVTTVDQFVLYSLCLKVEDECSLGCVDEIAAAVNQILSRIQEEEACWLYNN